MLILIFFSLFLQTTSNAQDYILASGYYGSSGQDGTTGYIVHNNNLYIIGSTIGNDFPTTDGSTIVNDADYFFLKYDANTMTLLEARLIGGIESDNAYEIRIDGSNIYIFGASSGTGMPSTAGTGHAGLQDVHVLKLDLDGNIIGGTYLGGSDFDFMNDVVVENGMAHLSISSSSTDFPVTDGSNNSGLNDIIYIQLDLGSLSITHATHIGGSRAETQSGIDIDGGSAFIGFQSASIDLPVTDATVYGGVLDLAVAAIDIATGNVTALTFLGGTSEDNFNDIVAEGGKVFIDGSSQSTDFTVTNGSSPFGQVSIIFAHYDANLNLQASTYVLEGYSFFPNLEYYNGFLYSGILGRQANEIHILKLDMNGNIVWDYAVKDSSPESLDILVSNDKVHFVTTFTGFNAVTTNGTYFNGGIDYYYSALSLNGDLEIAGYYGGSEFDAFNSRTRDYLQVVGSKVWLAGGSDNCFPTTNGSSHSTGSPNIYDVSALVIETCPSNFEGDPAPSPPSQTVCKNGFVVEIDIDPYLISGSVLPELTACANTYQQADVEAQYQWQSGPNASGPWTNIPGATKRNYTPIPLSITTCFRRLAKEAECCGAAVLQTSNVHCVNVGLNNAPIVDAGGIYNTCPGTPVTMSTSVSSGTPAYSYQWAEGNSTTVIGTGPNLTVTPTIVGGTIYTVTVTDANGCRQLDQSIVNAYAANAGPDISFCENQPGPTIGGTAIPGLQGVSYSWAPATGLSCTNCPNPVATPTTVTTYTLTLTVPVTNATTCATTDMVTVSPIQGPSTDFAGTDQVICFGTTGQIGDPAETGFSYTWAPGSYLTNNMVTPTIFDHGNFQFPNPNPIIYYLTAEKQGCTWYDDTEVAVIKADAGEDGCGPRYIGVGDQTPNINETWQWTKISGTGTITGPTNTPITTVSATPSGVTVYELTVTYNGTTCTDQVVVAQCGCDVDIAILGGIGCPSNILYEDVCLRAFGVIGGIPGPFTFSWSPNVGLDTDVGSDVCLTDNVQRTYTVTMTSVLDPSISCTEQISVNNPAWSEPTFMAQDPIVCPNQPVNIGQPNVAGYDYLWSPNNNLNISTIANPVATVPASTNYYVKVTDVLSGCITRDTATITVESTYANAGPDQVVCNASVLTLGTSPIANTTYAWTPVGANWQNGTNQNSPQPEVLVAINTTFIVTATNTISGCTDMDTVIVTVGQPVPPFLLPEVNYCPSQLSVTIGNGAPTGVGLTYSWSPNTNMNDPTIAMPTISPPPANGGLYTLIVTNASGCSYQQTQLLKPRVVAPIVAPSQVLCVGDMVQIGSNANPTGPGITYSWSPSIGLSNPSSPNPTFTATTVGLFSYTLTVTNNGCSNAATVNIVVNDFPITVGPTTVCEGGCTNIGVVAVPGATYNWSPTTGLDDPTSSNPLACVSVNTIYTLTATGPTGCQTIVNVPVFINPSPAPKVTIPTLNYCLGTSGQFIVPIVSPPGSYIYKWEPNNGTLIYPTSPSPELVLGSTGTYTYSVTVTNAASGCATEATATVIATICTLECNLTLVLDASDLACNGDNSGSIDLTTNGGTPPINFNWSNGSTTEDLNNLAAGTYTVIAEDVEGCIATGSVIVREPDHLVCVATVVQNVSTNGGNDGIAQITVNGGRMPYQYQWDANAGNQTTSVASGLSAGFYMVTVSDDSGCSAVCNVSITEPDAPCDICSEAENGNLDICVEILINPSIGTLDCDNGGIINSVECDNGGDPLDPDDDCMIAETAGVDICLEIGGDPTHPLATQDCDDGGVLNINECNNGDDPFDPADDCQSALDQGLNICALINYDPGHPLATFDCDNGGVDNITECNTGDDPSEPDDDCHAAVEAGMDICTIIGTSGHPWATLDCDDGSIDNQTECDRGTDPSDPSDDIICPIDYCEEAAIGNIDICIVINGDPNHPAATLDCDNGGIINIIECNNNGEPNDPEDDCDVAMAAGEDLCAIIGGDPDHPLANQDCDNGGVPNIIECNNNGDPADPMDDCSVAKAGNINICILINWDPTHLLATLDCDTGGVDNITECNNGLDACDPNDDCLAAVRGGLDICALINGDPNHPWASLDCDLGGEINIVECNDGRDPSLPSDDVICPVDLCFEAANGNVDICAILSADPDNPIGTEDCDNGGIINIIECNNSGDPNNPTDDCSIAIIDNVDICAEINGDPNHPLANQDCDEGGVINIIECNSNEDPADPADDCTAAIDEDINICIIIGFDPSHPMATLDCDNGGIDNWTECTNGGNPNDPVDDCSIVVDEEIDLCLILTDNPNNPLGTQDCDGDGVTNETECDDETDPLDPCDFIDTSITLPVTADQSDCINLCPDLTPINTILPGNIAGLSQVGVAIEISELNNIDTDGSNIKVRMPSDPRLVFVWDPGLTYVALTNVLNSNWNYLGDNGFVHCWEYNGPAGIIPGGTVSAFGFEAFYDPQNTDGQTTITSTIVPFSGGECNILNNTDSERLVYFE